MSVWPFVRDIEFDGLRIADVEMEFGSGSWAPRTPGEKPPRSDSPVDGWFVEMPAVLEMVAAVEQGRGTVGDIREALLATVKALTPHGCCPECEHNVDTYKKALAVYEEAKAEMERRGKTMTGESHPYTVTNNASVHLFNCPSAPREEVIHPGASLREFTHNPQGSHYQIWVGGGFKPTNGVGRMTGQELAAWIRQRRGAKGALNYRRCKRCQPALPVAYTSEMADAPGLSDGRH